MRSGKKPYENKRDVDPGRLRHVAQFYEQQAVDDGYGGTTVTDVLVLTTKAATESVNSYTWENQLGLDSAGLSQFRQLQVYVIRNRTGFYPQKDMSLVADGRDWTILGTLPMDDPEKFTRLLCGLRT